MITEAQLRQIMPNLAQAKAAQYLPFLNAAMQAHGVSTMLRTAAFIAQLAHESGEFRFMEEIWGPIPAQLRYEPATDLSKRLGNTQPGDGKRFKGRGPIQITGRFNYKKYGDLLGVDLTAAPEKAALPEHAFLTAGLFWRSNGLNEMADAERFVDITKRINGGTNGLPDREKYYARAKACLADGFVADAPQATRGARAAKPKLKRVAPLSRGFEAIAEDGGNEGAPAKKAAAKTAAGKKAAAKTAPAKKSAAAKKGAAKTATPAKKAAVKKAAATKTAAKKAVAKTAPAKKAAARKAAAQKAVTKKAVAKKVVAKKVAAKKSTATTKRPTAKKAAAKKRAG